MNLILRTVAAVTLALITSVGLVAAPHPVQAKESNRMYEEAKQKSEKNEKNRSHESLREDASSEPKEKLTPKKLEACKKHEDHIASGLRDSATKSTKQYEVFEKITQRVTELVAKKNLSVKNYDALVSEVERSRDAAKMASEKTQSLIDGWSCDAAAPKSQAKEIKLAKSQQITAMKDYKDAVRNLIIAVKSHANTSAKEVR